MAADKEEAFLDAVCQEVKWQAAWPGIREELADHVAEHAKELEEEGVPLEEAQERAVTAMGDAAAIGRELDELHRPQLAKGLLALGVLLTAGGVASIIYAVAHGHAHQITSTLAGVALGIVAAGVIYFSDYSRYLKWSPMLYGLGVALLIAVDQMGIAVNGRRLWLGTSVLRVNGYMIAALCFMAAVAGLLVLFRDEDAGALVGCGLLAALSVGLILHGSLTTAILMAFGYVWLFTQAICWGYFGDRRRRNYAVVYGAVGAVWLAIAAYILPAPWRVNRIIGMLPPFNDLSLGWASSRAILTLQHAQFIGPADMSAFGETGLSYHGILVEPMSDYAFMRLINDFGLLAGLVAAIGVWMLVVAGWRKVRLVKNHYGRLLGMMALIFLGGQSLVNIMINMGLFPESGSSLPFFAAGGSNMLMSWLYVGILLAVWRRNTILVEGYQPSRKIGRQREWITNIIRWQEGCLIIDFNRLFGKQETAEHSEGGYDDGNR